MHEVLLIALMCFPIEYAGINSPHVINTTVP